MPGKLFLAAVKLNLLACLANKTDRSALVSQTSAWFWAITESEEQVKIQMIKKRRNLVRSIGKRSADQKKQEERTRFLPVNN
jgi:hypothetical protein